MNDAPGHVSPTVAGDPPSEDSTLAGFRPLLAAGVGALIAGCNSGSGGGGSSGPTVPVPLTPAAPTTIADETEAALFLNRGTFGSTEEDVERLMQTGYEQWFYEQVAAPASSHQHHLQDKDGKRIANWWRVALWGPDQLRQRVAFALSQIFVVSQREVNEAQGLASYYDMLVEHAFGNFRDLLEDVTLHPVMGTYLSHIRNEKADPSKNIRPDENYAREAMQLFTIGLIELELDGTPKLQNGQPIPTYDQATIEGFAAVYTGWNFAGRTRWWENIKDWVHPMEPFESYHDTDPKELFPGVILPGGQTAEEDLQQALDILFQHPNVAPFIGKQLIQRLVTSNPSPAYVQRVAEVFEQDEFGDRGNLLAVVRAILFDPEALQGTAGDPSFGKLKEPLLRQTGFWRALRATGDPQNGHYERPENDYGQAPLRSPSVFNFFRPDFSQPGDLASAGLASPEFTLLDATYTTRTTNRFWYDVFRNYHGASNPDDVRIDISREKALADDPAALTEHLNQLLLAGRMSASMRATVESLITDTSDSDDGTKRALEAIYIVVSSPQFAVQQ